MAILGLFLGGGGVFFLVLFLAHTIPFFTIHTYKHSHTQIHCFLFIFVFHIAHTHKNRNINKIEGEKKERLDRSLERECRERKDYTRAMLLSNQAETKRKVVDLIARVTGVFFDIYTSILITPKFLFFVHFSPF